MEFMLPIKGISEGFPVDKSPPLTTGYANNIRAVDVLEKRVRIGQRPGLDKTYAQQIGGAAIPIIALCSITTID
jgi:hypothetical protein